MFFLSERLDFQTTIERTCAVLGDSWADKIRSSIAFAQDLVATGSNFRTNIQIPVTKQQIKAL